jgi:hypothetical protein
MATVTAEGSFGLKRVGASCCTVGPTIFAVGGLTYDDLYRRRAMSNDVSSWTSEYGWRHHRLAADRPAPSPRSGHTCCAREESVLVFGGHDEGHAKLGDLWELRTVGSVTVYRLEIGIDAVTTVAEQDADMAARIKAVGKQKGAQEELVPLPLYDEPTLHAALEQTLQLPPEAITLSEPSSSAERPGRVCVSLAIQPLYAVGMRIYGVDGEELPRAVLQGMRDQLRAAGVPEGMAEPPPDGKGDKGKKLPAAAKGKAASEPEPPAEAKPPPPGVGYAIKCWALHETEEPVPDQLSWRAWVPGGKLRSRRASLALLRPGVRTAALRTAS